MLTNLSIRTRLLAITVVAVAVLLFIAALGYVGLKRSNAGLETSITATLAVLNQKHADMMHDALRSDVLFAILTGPNGPAEDRQTVTSDLADHVADFENAISQLQDLPLPRPIQESVDEVVPLLDAYVASAQEIVGLALTSSAAGRAKLPDFMIAFSDLEASMETLGEQIESRGSAVGAAAQQANTVVKNILILGAALAAGALALVTRVIARSISNPLIEVKQGLTQLADGNLATRIGGTDRHDEIGEIATALEVLRDRLQQAKEQETEMLQGAQQRVVRALSASVPQPVRATTKAWRRPGSARIWRQTSMPSSTGRPRSSSTSSGWNCRATPRAMPPSAADATLWPNCCSKATRVSRPSGLSSTTRMRRPAIDTGATSPAASSKARLSTGRKPPAARAAA